MNKKTRKTIIFLIVILVLAWLGMSVFSVFFDQAIIVRKGTIYRVGTQNKIVALTFDDGPSLVWTPQILD